MIGVFCDCGICWSCFDYICIILLYFYCDISCEIFSQVSKMLVIYLHINFDVYWFGSWVFFFEFVYFVFALLYYILIIYFAHSFLLFFILTFLCEIFSQVSKILVIYLHINFDVYWFGSCNFFCFF